MKRRLLYEKIFDAVVIAGILLFEINRLIIFTSANANEVNNADYEMADKVTGVSEMYAESLMDFEPYYDNPADWYDSDGNVRMPILEDYDLWENSPVFADRCQLCAIPQAVLDSISTKDLVELVL